MLQTLAMDTTNEDSVNDGFDATMVRLANV